MDSKSPVLTLAPKGLHRGSLGIPLLWTWLLEVLWLALDSPHFDFSVISEDLVLAVFKFQKACILLSRWFFWRPRTWLNMAWGRITSLPSAMEGWLKGKGNDPIQRVTYCLPLQPWESFWVPLTQPGAGGWAKVAKCEVSVDLSENMRLYWKQKQCHVTSSSHWPQKLLKEAQDHRPWNWIAGLESLFFLLTSYVT